MRLIRRLLLAFTAFFVLLAFTISTLASSHTVPPTTQFTFSLLAKTESFTIDIDEKTKHKIIDEDGDTLVGAIFRVTPKNHVVTGTPRVTVGTFIYRVVAICGHRGLVVLQSSLFDPSGKEVLVSTDVEVIAVREPVAASYFIYRHLCAGYTGTGRNTVRWI